MGRGALALLVAWLALAGAANAAWSPGPVRYGVASQHNVTIRMSDGVRLLADVHRPTGGKPGETFPVLVSITPYSKSVSATLADPGSQLVRHGYIHVIAETRGTGSSGGTNQLLGEREQADGPAVVRFAAKLPGSNGKVGLYGPSYLGNNQFYTASRMGRDSPLKAILPIVPLGDFYREGLAPGGIPGPTLAVAFLAGTEAVLQSLPPSDLLANPVEALTDYARRLPTTATVAAPLLGEVLVTGTGRRFDGPFWQSRRPSNGLDEIVRNDIPTMIVSGWGDFGAQGAAAMYAELQNRSAGRPVGGPMKQRKQRIDPRFQLVQGPWFHDNGGLLQTSNIKIALRWFATWLKDEDTGLKTEKTPLHMFELGRNRWVDTGRWPVRTASPKTLYLRGGPSGTVRSLNDGGLSPAAPDNAAGEDALPASAAPPAPCSRAAEVYLTGLQSYVAANAGIESRQLNPCLADERPNAPLSLTYTSAPFDEDTSIAGPSTLTLYQRSDRPESSVIVTLQDIAPSGRATPVATGYQLASFRENDESRSWFLDGKLVRPYHPFTQSSRRPLPIGAVERVDVEISPVLARLKAGHRLRVAIVSGIAPVLTPPPGELAQTVGGTMRVQRSSGAASHINVPLIASDKLRTAKVNWGGCQGSCSP